MREFLRVAVFALLFMAHMTGAKSSVLKTNIRVNKRLLFPWLHIIKERVPKSRQEFRLMPSSCDGLQMGKCREKPEKLHTIKDKVAALQEFETEKKSGGSAVRSTSPPLGWWIYVNGHQRESRNIRALVSPTRPSTKDTARTVFDDFAEYLTLKRRGALDSCLGK